MRPLTGCFSMIFRAAIMPNPLRWRTSSVRMSFLIRVPTSRSKNPLQLIVIGAAGVPIDASYQQIVSSEPDKRAYMSIECRSSLSTQIQDVGDEEAWTG